MRQRLLVAATVIVVALGLTVAACTSDSATPDGTTPSIAETPDAAVTPEVTPEESDEDTTVDGDADGGDEIGELIEKYTQAFAKEDWEAIYAMFAPSFRSRCARGKFVATTEFAVRNIRELIGERAYQAVLDDAADGYVIQSTETRGDQSTVIALEEQGGIELLYEEGRWWLADEAGPCEFDIYD